MNSKTIELNAERWSRVEDLFARAVEMAADERERYLTSACGEDTELRDYIFKLLQADPAVETNIEQTIVNTVRVAFGDE